MSADTAPAAMPGAGEIALLIAGVMGRDNHSLALHTARAILDLFAPILAENEAYRANTEELRFSLNAVLDERLDNIRAKQAAEAALAAEREINRGDEKLPVNREPTPGQINAAAETVGFWARSYDLEFSASNQDSEAVKADLAFVLSVIRKLAAAIRAQDVIDIHFRETAKPEDEP